MTLFEASFFWTALCVVLFALVAHHFVSKGLFAHWHRQTILSPTILFVLQVATYIFVDYVYSYSQISDWLDHIKGGFITYIFAVYGVTAVLGTAETRHGQMTILTAVIICLSLYLFYGFNPAEHQLSSLYWRLLKVSAGIFAPYLVLAKYFEPRFDSTSAKLSLSAKGS